jgi:hypothetical protein
MAGHSTVHNTLNIETVRSIRHFAVQDAVLAMGSGLEAPDCLEHGILPDGQMRSAR